MKFLNAILLIVSLCVFVSVANAATFYDITLPDDITIKMKKDGKDVNKKLVMNGIGLREVKRFGFWVKVYVGALYLEEKSTDSVKILDSKGPKKLIMKFKRSVGRGDVQDGFVEGYKKTCKDLCSKYRSKLKEFNEFVGRVKKYDFINMTFHPESITVETIGKDPRKGTINGGHEFNKIMLGMYIGHNPPSKKFRKQFLGITAKKKK